MKAVHSYVPTCCGDCTGLTEGWCDGSLGCKEPTTARDEADVRGDTLAWRFMVGVTCITIIGLLVLAVAYLK